MNARLEDARRDKLIAELDAKVTEIKTAIHDANATLKDLRAERKELKAQLAWALEGYQQILAAMLEKSSAEILRATADVMAGVRRQLEETVSRAQSIQTLGRVDRLLRFVSSQLADDDDQDDVDEAEREAAPS